ncbi:MAG: iron-containing alcohol dehydrogenase [Rhodospirillales bacterium]|jgi:alcohol dehydrogenase class IV
MALITYLTRIQFDFGAIKLLPDEMKLAGIARPLLVTDKGVVAAGIAARVAAAMAPAPVATFDGTPSNPTERATKEALEHYRAQGCDGVVAVGGGSSMDLAKAVALMATHPGELAQYMAIEGGVARITAKVAPVIAVPTTAGTGSEVGRGAVVILDDGRKLALISPHLIPRLALCDPELTLGLPPGLTAATGMDALAHCVETFLAPAINPPADAIALDGAMRIGAHLERAVRDGGDREARWNMMMASMEGAMAFQKGLGAVHALSHPLGAIQPLNPHHGTLNAVVMPAVLRFNAGVNGIAWKYDRLRQAMGLAAGVDLADHVARLNARLGLPSGLRAMGIGEAMFAQVIPHALKDHTAATNPRPLTAESVAALLREAM